MLKTLVATLLLFVAVVVGEYTSPVFLWGVTSPSKPTLQTVKQNEFSDLIAPLLKTHTIVVFQEEQLSPRDFLCNKAGGSETCYASLKGAAPKTYYASVQNPNEAVRGLTETRDYNIIDSTGKLEAPLECQAGKVTFISFDDVLEGERAATLEAHDAAIAEITKEMSDCKVVYLYMSTPNQVVSKTRSKRSTAAISSGYVFRATNQFLIYWSSLQYNDGSDGAKYKDVVVEKISSIQNITNTQFNVTFATTDSNILNFTISLGMDGYYTMSSIGYASKVFYSSLLTAPTTFSFHCGNLTVNTIPSAASTDKVAYLKFNSLQFQAPFNGKTANDFKFGDAWDCVPFFTPGILSGLFVVILLLAITFTGICWIIDINTMDRFDDPKGKTISINASE